MVIKYKLDDDIHIYDINDNSIYIYSTPPITRICYAIKNERYIGNQCGACLYWWAGRECNSSGVLTCRLLALSSLYTIYLWVVTSAHNAIDIDWLRLGVCLLHSLLCAWGKKTIVLKTFGYICVAFPQVWMLECGCGLTKV